MTAESETREHLTQDESAARPILSSHAAAANAEENGKKSTAKGIFNQVFLTVIVSITMISMAQALAFPAVFLPQVADANQTIYMDRDAGSWYSSVNSLSSPIGSLLIGIVMDRFGRKVALAVPLIPMIAAHLATAFSQTNFVLLCSRIALGLCLGCLPPVCQIYVAECADSKLRGATMNMSYVSLSVGFLSVFVLGAAFTWRTITFTFIILPILVCIGLCFVPETPVWLVRHGQQTKAYQSFEWLRGSKDLARNELNEYLVRFEQEKAQAAARTERTSIWYNFRQSAVLRPLFIITAFITLFNISGTYPIVYYALDIISQVGLEASKQSIAIYLSVIRLIVTVGFCVIFMRVQRRSFYLFAGIGSTVSTLLLALFLHNRTAIDVAHHYDQWIVGLLLIAYVATNTGFMIMPGFLIGELLPAKVRGQLAGYIYMFFSVVTFGVVKIFPAVGAGIGIVGILYVFSGASFLTAALVFAMVPETRGKSLLEIERYFQESGWLYKPIVDETKAVATEATQPEKV